MKYFLTFFSFFLLITPVLVLAQYQPLVGIPGVDDAQNFDQYLQSVYVLAISLAALLAVIKIVIAGVKWMTTDIVDTKSSAKKDIQGAIFGLLIILGAVLILNIINPNISTVNLTLAPVPDRIAAETNPDPSAIQDCKDNPSTCTLTTISCPEVSNQYLESGNQNTNQYQEGPGTSIEYNCDGAENTCIGTFIVNSGGNSGKCVTTEADIVAALPDIANSNCPVGETCSATLCDQGQTSLYASCESACTVGKSNSDDSAGIFDSASKACVTY
jgi:type IV secretory pathway VirB2 component (pilin)